MATIGTYSREDGTYTLDHISDALADFVIGVAYEHGEGRLEGQSQWRLWQIFNEEVGGVTAGLAFNDPGTLGVTAARLSAILFQMAENAAQ